LSARASEALKDATRRLAKLNVDLSKPTASADEIP
jgi:hypothetical protein